VQGRKKAAVKGSGRRGQGYQGPHDRQWKEIPGHLNLRKAMSISYLTYGWLGLINSVESIPAEASRISLFDGNQRFITLFITTGYWSLSWDGWICSAPFHPVSLGSILLMTSHVQFESLFSSSRRVEKILCVRSREHKQTAKFTRSVAIDDVCLVLTHMFVVLYICS